MSEIIVKDSCGNVLHNGDSVRVIKDLKVKGSSAVLKRGDTIKNIRLVDDEDHVEVRFGKAVFVLKTEFLRKS